MTKEPELSNVTIACKNVVHQRRTYFMIRCGDNTRCIQTHGFSPLDSPDPGGYITKEDLADLVEFLKSFLSVIPKIGPGTVREREEE